MVASQVRSCWTLWLTLGTSSSVMSCPCCRPFSTPYKYAHPCTTSANNPCVGSMLICSFLQGKEPSVRQLALLHFRNIITLNLKLDEALSRPRARVPPSIVQMLLILQVQTHTPSVFFFPPSSLSWLWCKRLATRIDEGCRRSRGEGTRQTGISQEVISVWTPSTVTFPWPLGTLFPLFVCVNYPCLRFWLNQWHPSKARETYSSEFTVSVAAAPCSGSPQQSAECHSWRNRGRQKLCPHLWAH